MTPVTIIGSGMAGYTLAREFRKLDKTTPLLIITTDDGGFYSKPMLSNAFAQNKQAAQLVSQTAAQMAEQLNANILQHTSVSQINTDNKTISTSAGEFAYDKLILAVGAQPIRLPIAGNAADKVMSVNHVSDYAALRKSMIAIGEKTRITILGAGLIGCEFADDLAGAGHLVTLVDPNPRPLAALAPEPISNVLQAALAQRGVKFRLGTSASSIDYITNTEPSAANPQLTAQQAAQHATLVVTLASDDIIEADIVLSAVGLRPDLRLAVAAKLATERGILVDTTGLTSASDVYALGDCAQYTNPEDGSRPVLPYIAPIMTAARAIARSLTGEITQIELKPAPVIVKTPSCPIALVAPALHLAAQGRWQHEHLASPNPSISRFYAADGSLKGFAIAPQDAKLRAALLAEMSAPATTPATTAILPA